MNPFLSTSLEGILIGVLCIHFSFFLQFHPEDEPVDVSDKRKTSIEFVIQSKITGGSIRPDDSDSDTYCLPHSVMLHHDLGQHASSCLSQPSWCPDGDADLWPPCKLEQRKCSMNGGEIDRIYWSWQSS